MSRALVAAALALALAAPARGAPGQLAEGAPVYASARWAAFVGVLAMLGVSEMPEVQQLRQQLGGIDPLNPALLGPTGLDVAGAIQASLLEAAGPKGLMHHRVILPLRDAALFNAFVSGVAASGEVPLQAQPADSPLGKRGVTAVIGNEKLGLVAILRRGGPQAAVLDAFTVMSGTLPAPGELARRYPVAPARPAAMDKGARRLLGPAGALTVALDGRRLFPVVQAFAPSGGQPTPACKTEWAKAPTALDDVALTVDAEGKTLKVSLAWGNQSGPFLGGARLGAVDDGVFDAQLLGREAVAFLGLYAASLQPFAKLPRRGPFASLDALSKSVGRCGALALGTLLVRSWPNGLGTLAAESQKGPKGGGADAMLGSALGTLGRLRNLVLVLRDVPEGQNARFAGGATLDGDARPLVESLLGTMAGSGAPTPIGKHNPTVYQLSFAQVRGVAALENLPGGPFALTITDSEDSLAWALRTLTALPGAPKPAAAPVPLVGLALDTRQAVAALPRALGKSDAQPVAALLRRFARLEANVALDDGLVRVDLRAPLAQ